jgi:DNA-3-methyladenine glycosylase
MERHGFCPTEIVILPRSFYRRATVDVARSLLGQILVHGETAGIIVETEAYLGGEDLAAHSATGITDRTRVIFGPPGHAYIYLSYGMHDCLNIVAEPAGAPGCVLIRAIEPTEGLDIMRSRRARVRSDRDLASGPGKLTQALGITRALSGKDMTKGNLVVRAGSTEGIAIVVTPRIGITKCADWPLRFIIKDNKFVSRARP